MLRVGWLQNGIVQGHAYGILRLEEVTISGTDYHMILVRYTAALVAHHMPTSLTFLPPGARRGRVPCKPRNQVRNPWGDNPPASATPLDWFPTSPMWNRRGGEYMKRKLDYNPESRTCCDCAAAMERCE